MQHLNVPWHECGPLAFVALHLRHEARELDQPEASGISTLADKQLRAGCYLSYACDWALLPACKQCSCMQQDESPWKSR